MRKPKFKIGDLVSEYGKVGVVVQVITISTNVRSYRVRWDDGSLLWEAGQFLTMEVAA